MVRKLIKSIRWYFRTKFSLLLPVPTFLPQLTTLFPIHVQSSYLPAGNPYFSGLLVSSFHFAESVLMIDVFSSVF